MTIYRCVYHILEEIMGSIRTIITLSEEDKRWLEASGPSLLCQKRINAGWRVTAMHIKYLLLKRFAREFAD
jgi:hypothetical protein